MGFGEGLCIFRELGSNSDYFWSLGSSMYSLGFRKHGQNSCTFKIRKKKTT